MKCRDLQERLWNYRVETEKVIGRAKAPDSIAMPYPDFAELWKDADPRDVHLTGNVDSPGPDDTGYAFMGLPVLIEPGLAPGKVRLNWSVVL